MWIFRRKSSKESIEKVFPTEDPETSNYLIAIISYFVTLTLIGIPIWLYTTRVYRADLPLDDLINLPVTESINGTRKTVPLSSHYDILLTYMVPVELQFVTDQSHLANELEAGLKQDFGSVADFTISTQRVYYTTSSSPLQITYTDSSDKCKIPLRHTDISGIITRIEDKLGPHFNTTPRLNLIVYFIPDHCSLQLEEYGSETMEFFLSPGWGAFFVYQPEIIKNTTLKGPFQPDLNRLYNVFLSEIRLLFGLKTNHHQEFQMRKTEEFLQEAKKTLKSLGKLLVEIPSLVIEEYVAEKIITALGSVEYAEFLLAKNDTSDDTIRHAQLAYNNAEEAFRDPSLLVLLYFPDDQKYAIYVPLFIPLIIPILLSLKNIKTPLFTINLSVKINTNIN